MEQLFKELGYQLLSLPNSDTKPKDLLCKSGNAKANRLNTSLNELFTEGDNIKYPVTSADIILPKFKGKQLIDFNTSFGLKLLTGLFEKLGIKELKADAKWGSLDKVIFSFKNMREQNISLMNLDKYIHDANVNLQAQNFAKKLESDDIYVITSILKCDDFSVEKVDFSELGLSTSASVNEILDAHAKLNRSHSHKDGVTYKGDTPLTIAVKAVQIFMKNHGGKLRKKQNTAIQEVESLSVRGVVTYLMEENGLDI